MLKLQQEARDRQTLIDYVMAGHKKPTTRREFLSAGLQTVATFMAAPTVAQLFAQTSWAADEVVCAGSDASVGMPAFIHIQVAGGAALFANAIPRGDNGADLPNYGALGLGSAPPVELMFANRAPWWVASSSFPASEIMRGIQRAAPTASNSDIYNNTAFVSVASESVDDTAANPQDITGLLQAAGLVGNMFPYLRASNVASSFPTNFTSSHLPIVNTLNVANAAALAGSLGLTGALGTPNLTVAQQTKLIQTIENLNKEQVRALASESDPSKTKATLQSLVNCSSKKNTELLAVSTSVDIYNASFQPSGPALANIWALNRATDAGFDKSQMDFTLSRSGLTTANTLLGKAGAAVIYLGGYDYHIGNTRAFANARDNFLGDVIGRILMTAKTLARPVFVYVSTDGALSSPQSDSATVNWSGDLPKRAMGYMFAYKPTGAPSTAGFSMDGYTDASYQLNHFNNSGVVDNKNPIGAVDAQRLAAAAVFLNYLNFAGKPGLLDTVAALAPVKKALTDALPKGASSINNYYTRIKS